MKSIRNLARRAFRSVTIGIALLLASCVSTTTTFPDGRIVKEIKPDSSAVSAFTNLAAALAPKAVVVEDNSVQTTIHAAK